MVVDNKSRGPFLSKDWRLECLQGAVNTALFLFVCFVLFCFLLCFLFFVGVFLFPVHLGLIIAKFVKYN